MREMPRVSRACAALLALLLLRGLAFLRRAQPGPENRSEGGGDLGAVSDARGAATRVRAHAWSREMRLWRRSLQGHMEAMLGQVEKFERELELAKQAQAHVPPGMPLAPAATKVEWSAALQESEPPGPLGGKHQPGREDTDTSPHRSQEWAAQRTGPDKPPSPPQATWPGTRSLQDGAAGGSPAVEALPPDDALEDSTLRGLGAGAAARLVPGTGQMHEAEQPAAHSQLLNAQVLDLVEQPGGAERSTNHVPQGSMQGLDLASGSENTSSVTTEVHSSGEGKRQEDPASGGTLPAPYETTLWISEIRYSALRVLDLRYYQGLHCRGGGCPSFEECGKTTPSTALQQEEGSLPGRVRACWNADLVDPTPIISAPALNAEWERHADAGAAAAVPGAAAGVQHSRRLQGQEGDRAEAPGCQPAGLPQEEVAPAAAQAQPKQEVAPAAAQAQPKHSWEEKPMTAEDVQDGDAYAGQLFELEDVFVNDRGSIMDAHTLYRHAVFCRTCPLDFGVYVGNQTVVTVFEEMLTLAYWNGANFYHAMVEVLPSLVVARQLLEQKPRIPVALRMLQDLHGHVFDLIGRPMETLNIHVLPDAQLFFARRLYVPAQAPCGRPSRAALGFLRANYLVPPWPLLLRSPAARSDNPSILARATVHGGQGQRWGGNAEPAAIREDEEWYVAVGHRESTRRIVGRERLYEALRARFPPQRIVLFDGNTSIQAARDVFNKVRLFISPHGALMTNMLFMPAGAYVVEVRPSAFNNGCYHYLAHILGMHYYLLRGNGTKESDIQIDLPRLVAIAEHVAERLQGQDAVPPGADGRG